MNPYFRYDHYDIWNEQNWGVNIPIDPLIQWIGALDPQKESDYRLPEGVCLPGTGDETGFIGYVDPEEAAYWASIGMTLEIHHIWTAVWLSLVPARAVRGSGVLYPTVLSMHQESPSDGTWPMKTIAKYRELGTEAAKEGRILLVVVTQGPDVSKQYGNILMEAISLYPIDHNHILLDVQPVYDTGHHLKDLEGGIAEDETGRRLKDPDAAVCTLGGRRLLDISRTWKGIASPHWGQLIGENGMHSGNADYDSMRFRHSLMAQRLTEPVIMEHTYTRGNDAGLTALWKYHGVDYEEHDTRHERWVSLVPSCAAEHPDTKLPLMLIFQEVYYCNDHLIVEAESYWYEYCRLVMQGDCIVLFYACEREDHNELMADIAREAMELYPIDRTRVYITGYSHNSGFATRFAYKHPDLITALAGGNPGMLMMGVAPQDREQAMQAYQAIDMPFIWISGCNEHNRPVGGATFENDRFNIFNNMTALQIGGCTRFGLEDFRAAYESGDKATRMLGVPNDRSEVLYLEGDEHYIADIRNDQGRYHMRFVSIENMPHNPHPTMQILEWSFVRRFARDPETKEILELN